MRYKADIRTLITVASFFALVATGFLWRPQSWWYRVPLIAVTAQMSFICAIITHNTIHVPMFRVRWVNKLVQVVLTLSYGHPVSAYVPGHNLSHHVHTQTNRDIMRTTKARFRWNLLNQLLFFYIMSKTVTLANFKYTAHMYKRKPSWFRQFIIESTIFVGAMATLLVIDWQSFIMYVLIPHQFAGWGIVGINYVQHDGCDHTHPVNHSRNFVGRLTNFWTFNNGFHGVHHIKPAMHWSLLPAAHREMMSPTIHPNLEQKSLLIYLFRAYGWPGKRVTYDGKPVVLAPLQPDEPWIPDLMNLPAGVSLGAES